MLFIFFTAIVFISELIIAAALISNLLKFDKILKNANSFIVLKKDDIKRIAELANGISAQMAELVPFWIQKFKDARDRMIINKLSSLFAGFLVCSINMKIINKLRKLRLVRLILPGLLRN